MHLFHSGLNADSLQSDLYRLQPPTFGLQTTAIFGFENVTKAGARRQSKLKLPQKKQRRKVTHFKHLHDYFRCLWVVKWLLFQIERVLAIIFSAVFYKQYDRRNLRISFISCLATGMRLDKNSYFSPKPTATDIHADTHLHIFQVAFYTLIER